MKAKILLCSMLILGSLSYAAETTPTDSVAQEVMSEVKSIEVFARGAINKSAACDGIHAGRLIDTCRCDISLIRTCGGIEVFHEAGGSVRSKEAGT